MKSFTLTFLLLFPASVANAQGSWVVPKAFASQNAGSTNGFPWTYTGYVRMQQAIAPAEMGFPRLVEGMSLRPRNWGLGQQTPFTKTFSIKLSYSANAVNQLNGTFANNIKGTQIEVFKGPVYFPTPTGNSPAEFSVTIPFKKRFIYLGKDPLLVDVAPLDACAGGGDSRGSDYDRTSTNMGNVIAKNKLGCGTPTSGGIQQPGGYVIKFWGPVLMEYGYGCKGSSGKTPLIASSGGSPSTGNSLFTVDLIDGKASSAAALILGLSRTKFAGSVPLPLDLRGLGTPGCWLWSDVSVVGGAGINALGRAKLPMPIPNQTAYIGLQVFFQWVSIDQKANPGGLAFSSGGLIVIR